MNQEHEVQYWSKKLGVTPQRLREAAQKAGPMVKDIKLQLDQ